MNVTESYRATLGGLHVVEVYSAIGKVSLAQDPTQSSILNEGQCLWLMNNTDAKVTKVRVTVEEIEFEKERL